MKIFHPIKTKSKTYKKALKTKKKVKKAYQFSFEVMLSSTSGTGFRSGVEDSVAEPFTLARLVSDHHDLLKGGVLVPEITRYLV